MLPSGQLVRDQNIINGSDNYQIIKFANYQIEREGL